MMAPQPETDQRQEAIETQALLTGLRELSSRAAHDLVGPVNQAAALLALFVKRYRSRLDPEADKLLGFLESASARMDGVTAGVRRYMEIASRPPSFGPVDLSASLASALARLQKPIAESGAVIASDSLRVITADSAHMVTIFEILIDNAIKFRKPDMPPRIQFSYRPPAEIGVSDNGIGIDPHHSETVFLPFKRLNGAEYIGSGLGLATAKLITEMHGGEIRIGKQPSHGTQVCFSVRALQNK
jgi:light-regulated signal transduction histidine kinase (bacteriophytochrome)